MEAIKAFLFNAFVAAIILVVGIYVSKLIKGFLDRLLTRRGVEPTITKFLVNLAYAALIVYVVIAALNRLGLHTTSFVMVIGAAGLAIGLALQGSLANFASGFLLIIFKPFAVGNYVEAGGTSGIVEEITIFQTRMRTPDNKAVIVPNSKITADVITNYSANDTRRLDLVIGVSYSDDLDLVAQTLHDILKNDERILEDPEPTIGVTELGDSSVNFAVRPWVNSADYLNVLFDLTAEIKKRFDAEGISIPFPQRDVHLYDVKAS